MRGTPTRVLKTAATARSRPIWRTRDLDHTSFPYIYLDATYLHVRDDHEIVSKAVVVATGITAGGQREVLGLDVGDSEDDAFRRAFLRSLKNRGLGGVRLVISDQHAGLTAAIRRCFQGAAISVAGSISPGTFWPGSPKRPRTWSLRCSAPCSRGSTRQRSTPSGTTSERPWPNGGPKQPT
jgi:hypothetical protein